MITMDPGHNARMGVIGEDFFTHWDFKSADAHPMMTSHLLCVGSGFGPFYIDLFQTYQYKTRVEAITFMRVMNKIMKKTQDRNQIKAALRRAKIQTLTERAGALQKRHIPEGMKISVNIMKAAQQYPARTPSPRHQS